jgi:hypothetical protein
LKLIEKYKIIEKNENENVQWHSKIMALCATDKSRHAAEKTRLL